MPRPVLPRRTSERLPVQRRVVTAGDSLGELQVAFQLLPTAHPHGEREVLPQLVPLVLLRLRVVDLRVQLLEQVPPEVIPWRGLVEHLGEDPGHEHRLGSIRPHVGAAVQAASTEDVLCLRLRQQHVEDRCSRDPRLYRIVVAHIDHLRDPVARHIGQPDTPQYVLHLLVQVGRLHQLLHDSGGQRPSLGMDGLEVLLHHACQCLLGASISGGPVHTCEELHQLRCEVDAEVGEGVAEVVDQPAGALLRQGGGQVGDYVDPSPVPEQVVVRQVPLLTTGGEYVLHAVGLELDLVAQVLQRHPKVHRQPVLGVLLEVDDAAGVRGRQRVRLIAVDGDTCGPVVVHVLPAQLVVDLAGCLHPVAVQQNLDLGALGLHQGQHITSTELRAGSGQAVLVGAVQVLLDGLAQLLCSRNLSSRVALRVHDLTQPQQVIEPVLVVHHRRQLRAHLGTDLRALRQAEAAVGVHRNQILRQGDAPLQVP